MALSRSDEREIINHRRLGHPHVLGFREVYLARPDPKQASAPAGDCHHLVVRAVCAFFLQGYCMSSVGWRLSIWRAPDLKEYRQALQYLRLVSLSLLIHLAPPVAPQSFFAGGH